MQPAFLWHKFQIEYWQWLTQERSLFLHQLKAQADMAAVLHKVIKESASFYFVVCSPQFLDASLPSIQI